MTRCPFCRGVLSGTFCPRCQRQGRIIDDFVACEVGKPTDIGWAIFVLNADETATRTCKGCHRSMTSRVVGSEVERVAFAHADDCPMFARFGNNPGLS